MGKINVSKKKYRVYYEKIRVDKEVWVSATSRTLGLEVVATTKPEAKRRMTEAIQNQ